MDSKATAHAWVLICGDTVATGIDHERVVVSWHFAVQNRFFNIIPRLATRITTTQAFDNG